MIDQTLQQVLVTQADRGLSSVALVTDGGAYRIDGEGYTRLTEAAPAGADVLPAAFRGRRIVEVRCNGEDIAIRLTDGTFISAGWQIDTRTGRGYLDVLFHGRDDVDDDFREFYAQLDPCDEPRGG